MMTRVSGCLTMCVYPLVFVWMMIYEAHSISNGAYACKSSENPCLNNGICSMNETFPLAWMCLCKRGFTGHLCQYRDLCKESPCHNGAVCTLDDAAKKRCQCQTGWLGVNCSVSDPCIPSPCMNEAKCHVIGNYFDWMCGCRGNWTGRFCNETKTPPCIKTIASLPYGKVDCLDDPWCLSMLGLCGGIVLTAGMATLIIKICPGTRPGKFEMLERSIERYYGDPGSRERYMRERYSNPGTNMSARRRYNLDGRPGDTELTIRGGRKQTPDRGGPAAMRMAARKARAQQDEVAERRAKKTGDKGSKIIYDSEELKHRGTTGRMRESQRAGDVLVKSPKRRRDKNSKELDTVSMEPHLRRKLSMESADQISFYDDQAGSRLKHSHLSRPLDNPMSDPLDRKQLMRARNKLGSGRDPDGRRVRDPQRMRRREERYRYAAPYDYIDKELYPSKTDPI